MQNVKVVMVAAPNAGVTEPEMQACAAALTQQSQQDFGLPPPHGYGVGADVRVASSLFDVLPGEWVMLLLAHPDQEGALGYHDQTAKGEPIMKVFPLLDAADGVRWETTASHELLEALADPNCARCAQSYDGRVWAYEVCDACEQQSYVVAGVPVSDFVLPCYFEPVQQVERFDHMGLVTKPLEILPGGYGQYLGTVGGWHQVQHAQVPPRPARMQRLGRRARRQRLVVRE